MQILTKKIEAYNFDELDEAAKDEFRYLENQNWWGTVHAEDFKNTFTKFCNEFDINWHEYDVSPPQAIYNFGITNDTLRYHDKDLHEDLIYKLSVLKASEDCPLTGFYADESILKPIRKLKFTKKFCDSFYKEFDIEKLFDDCINNWLGDLQKEYDYYFSNEGLSELCKMNDYLFTKNGKLI